MPQLSFETSIVALTIAGVERLRQAFAQASTNDQRLPLLKAAAELLDRTLPGAEVKPALVAAASNPVPTLVAHREQIAAVPPGLWRPSVARVKDLPAQHQAGWRALDAVLRRAPTHAEQWDALVDWLEPVWPTYPQLKDEALALRPSILRPLHTNKRAP